MSFIIDRLFGRLATAAGLFSKPHFLVIGAQKAGTTSLHELLSQHPNLVPPAEKELHYFDDAKITYGNEISYHKQFPSRLLSGQAGKFTFETTPSYLYHPDCPGRIHKYSPSIKLIAVLREPVSRAYSAWRMYHSFCNSADESVRQMGDSRSFDEAVDEELPRWKSTSWHNDMNAYITRGIYIDQIHRYLNYFELGRDLFVCGYEELFESPERVYHQITDFLDLPRHEPEVIPHAGAGQKNPAPMQSSTQARLADFYRPFNKQLFKLLGKELTWK